MKRVLNIFFRTKGTRPFALLFCLTLAGFAQGLGIASLLPLISLVLEGATDSSNPAVIYFEKMFGFLGIELNVTNLLFFSVLSVIVKNVFTLSAMTYVSYTGAQIATDYRLGMVRGLLSVQWSFFTNQPLGKTMNAMGGLASRSSKAYLLSAHLIAGSIKAVVYIGVAFLVSWQIALVGLFLGSLIAVMVSSLVRRARQAGVTQTKYSQRFSKYLIDTMNNIKPLKAMARQSDFAQVLDRNILKLRKALRRQAFAEQALNSSNDILGTIAIATAFGVAIVQFGFQPADVAVTGLLLNQLLKTIRTLQSSYQKAVVQESAYYTLAEQVSEIERRQEVDTSSEIPTFEREIRFHNVAFSHPGTPVLNGVSLTFKCHETTVLTGPSGSGKTTITDIILGFASPDAGQVLLDGRPLSEFSLSEWRSQIGYVPQEPILFRDTVFTNVALGNKDIGEEEVRNALEIAGALEFVDDMPKGIHSQVGEKGAMISGGQRQRIAIARALVTVPSLLILDEVTSALDPQSEKTILRNIERLKNKFSVIAITHRPAFLQIADRVYHLEAGNVVSDPDRLASMQKIHV